MDKRVYNWIMAYDFPQGPYDTMSQWQGQFDKFCNDLRAFRESLS